MSIGFNFHTFSLTLKSKGVEISPPAHTLIESASAAMNIGGAKLLISMLKNWEKRPLPQVFVVDEKGNEILNRAYAKKSLDAANQLLKDKSTSSVMQLIDKNGNKYIMFVPDTGKWPPTRHHNKAPPEPTLLNLDNPIQLPFWPTIISLIVSLFFAALLTRYFSQPIHILHYAFSQGATGNLNSDLSKLMSGRNDAFSDLGKNFDSMTNRLGKLINGQKRLLNHVSHELRSPLSRMQIAIGLAKQNPEKVSSSLDRIQLESDRMDQLIGELLQLSRLDSGVSALNKKTVNLSHLIQDMLNDASFEAAEKNITVAGDISPDCHLNCEAELIYRAVENIIRNALKYTHPDSTVLVSLKQTERHLQIAVTDEGDGVDDSALEDIFQPFVRTNHAQPKHGYGIGLALAKQVIEAHDGSIRASNNPAHKGLVVSIQLPRT